MRTPSLLCDLIALSTDRRPDALAVGDGGRTLSYGELHAATQGCASGLITLGLLRAERVGIYLEKRFETVIAAFGASLAGGVFVPINPLLKPEQVGYILRDCNVRILITSRERLEQLSIVLEDCADLAHVVIVNDATPMPESRPALIGWKELLASSPRQLHRVIDTDMSAILYTSGSTGKPKGVVLSHRNLVTGATSVASYLENGPDDSLLAALPLSFDAGFSQLTTAFHAGARVVLLNYLLPRDVLKTMEAERITGFTAVPPLYIQLAKLQWPGSINETLRYFASTGGRMPLETLSEIRARVPAAKPVLMYGLTEAFRSTYLPPEQIDRRPDSIGKAIPNAEILVLREDGAPCAPNEPGELVHRGALVAQGYWNDAEKTAERFRPLPTVSAQRKGLMLPEIAVFSGDTVRMDEEGFLYFIGRRDQMIKTSGYRISPTEVEDVIYSTKMVGECAAFGVEDAILGQRIHVVATPLPGQELDAADLLAECRTRMPAYMLPSAIEIRESPLPRNANGKIDSKLLSLPYRKDRG